VAALLSSLHVERTPTGGLHLEAPPETAGALAGLFRALATQLERSAPEPAEQSDGSQAPAASGPAVSAAADGTTDTAPPRPAEPHD